MKLAAIYNVWDGEEHLLGSIKCLTGHVDLFIIVFQRISNFGEVHDPLGNYMKQTISDCIPIQHDLHFVEFHPEIKPTSGTGFSNEAAKRNLGIREARGFGATHFMFMDCDEYYFDFPRAKNIYIESGSAGSVCYILTYFRNPTLRHQGRDNYYVPFIHRLKYNTVTGVPNYPFYVDPTRRINESDVALLDVDMHHYSWVRKDIMRKVRNSSAKKHIERSNHIELYHTATEGTIVDGQPLIKVPDLIGWKF